MMWKESGRGVKGEGGGENSQGGGRAAKRTFNKRCAEIAPLPQPALFTGARQLWPRSAAVAPRYTRRRVACVRACVCVYLRAHRRAYVRDNSRVCARAHEVCMRVRAADVRATRLFARSLSVYLHPLFYESRHSSSWSTRTNGRVGNLSLSLSLDCENALTIRC